MARYYSSIAQEAELTSGATASDTTLSVNSLTGWPASVPFTAVIDPGLASEEIVTVTAVGGLNLTVVRGEDGSAAISHDPGAAVRHMATGRDLRDAQEHIDATTNAHGVGLGNAIVGTGTTQTLTNKSISGSNNTLTNIAQSSVTGLVADLDAIEEDVADLFSADASHAALVAAHGATGAVVGTTNSQTLTNKTLTAPVITSPPSNVANPAGLISQWGGSSIPPSGWLLCDGTVVSRATYADLFAAIGTSYNTGGETGSEFRLPNLVGRVPVGYDSGQSEFNTMGKTGGAKTHTLVEAELPAHNHTIAHTHTGTTASSAVTANFSIYNAESGSSISKVAGGAGEGGAYSGTISGSSHTHTFTTGASSAANSGTTGGGGAHNNLQPYLTVRYIIKF